MSDHEFHVTATWDVNEKNGRVTSADGALAVAHAGAASLGGKGGATNPEELLAAAVATCFVQTWAIFLAKLKVPMEHPLVAAQCTVEADPAGGFRVTRVELKPRVPLAVWDAKRADVEKTLSLAEKYCIISKAVRGDGGVLVVTPDPL